jgi:hypothetical protein
VSFAAITLCVFSQRATPKVHVYFIIDSVRKLLNTPLYIKFVIFWIVAPCSVVIGCQRLRRTMLPLYSGLKCAVNRALKMEAARLSETLKSDHDTIRCTNPEKQEFYFPAVKT